MTEKTSFERRFAASVAQAFVHQRADRIAAMRTIEADVGIVGTGFAGLAAALASREAGASKVVLLEKQSAPGGNSIMNAGQVAVAGSEKQKEQNVDDTVERMVEDMRKAGACVPATDHASVNIHLRI